MHCFASSLGSSPQLSVSVATNWLPAAMGGTDRLVCSNDIRAYCGTEISDKNPKRDVDNPRAGHDLEA